jgi:hypothetical protein
LKDEICEQFNALGAIDVFTDILEDSLETIDNQESILNAAEAMKALFKLSMSLGVLSDAGPEMGVGKAPTPKELEQFTRLVPIILRVLKLPYSPRIHCLKEAVVNLLINVPTACTTLFPHEETLSSLIEILTVQSKDQIKYVPSSSSSSSSFLPSSPSDVRPFQCCYFTHSYLVGNDFHR